MLKSFAFLRLKNKAQLFPHSAVTKPVLFQQPFCTHSFCVCCHNNGLFLVLLQRICKLVYHSCGYSTVLELFNDREPFYRKFSCFCDKALKLYGNKYSAIMFYLVVVTNDN